MASSRSDLASPRLRQLAAGAGANGPEPPGAGATQAEPVEAGATQAESCELCGARVPHEHRHLVDLESRQLMCVCRACSLLFDRRAAGGGHLRLVPDRRLALADFELDDATWAQLRIPVDMAFFFTSSPADRVLAFYPGPMGATESRLELDTWQEVEEANPVLATMEPDVEALLVNRARGARDHYVVPVEDCYRLVALIRTRWRGFTGGKEVWSEIDRFFARLNHQARRPDRRSVQPNT